MSRVSAPPTRTSDRDNIKPRKNGTQPQCTEQQTWDPRLHQLASRTRYCRMRSSTPLAAWLAPLSKRVLREHHNAALCHGRRSCNRRPRNRSGCVTVGPGPLSGPSGVPGAGVRIGTGAGAAGTGATCAGPSWHHNTDQSCTGGSKGRGGDGGFGRLGRLGGREADGGGRAEARDPPPRRECGPQPQQRRTVAQAAERLLCTLARPPHRPAGVLAGRAGGGAAVGEAEAEAVEEGETAVGRRAVPKRSLKGVPLGHHPGERELCRRRLKGAHTLALAQCHGEPLGNRRTRRGVETDGRRRESCRVSQ
mmetsp:Transcript_30257/g.99253  ORF Transcript_30257/g.99253 Transcript_30257/m.99253 type:complete len:307 (+) Transcript_30257:69-989(+)